VTLRINSTLDNSYRPEMIFL